MSGQRSKKVRIGSSRHKAWNRSKKSKADDGIHNTDRPPVAQYHMAEESVESSGTLAGNQNLSSSDVTWNGRKLESSRMNRGRQDVKDSIAKSYHETREEVVENNTCYEALFGNRSKLPLSTVEIESASNLSLDFVEPDHSYKKGIHVENLSDERSPETMYDVMSIPPKEETDKVIVSVSHPPQNMESLPGQSHVFKEENTELNGNIVKEEEIMLDEETVQDKSKGKMSTLATEKQSQEEMSQGSEYDVVSSTHDSAVYSSSTPDQSFEFGNATAANYSEVFPEGLIGRSEEEVVVDDNRVDYEDKLEASDLCKPAEINFEEMGEFHTFASKEICDYGRDTEQLDGTSQLFRCISDSAPSTDQLIDQSKSRENPEHDALRGMHAVLGKEEESKERVGAMEWLKPSGNLKGNYLVSEPPMKVEDTESHIQEKNSPIEHNQPECIVEPGPSHDNIAQSSFTLPTEEPLTENGHNEHFKLSQATDTNLFAQLHHPDDTVNYKVAEQVYESTQMREINSIHNFDGSVLRAAAENLDVPCAELIEDRGEKEDHIAKEIDISYEDSYSQSLPAAQNKNVLSETLNVFDISHEEDLKEIVTNPEVHEPQPSWTSDADAPDTLQSRPDTLDRPEQNSDNDENPHIKSNSRGRRRKMGSTRRNLRGRHEEKNTEKMQEETSLMQLIQEKRGGMTTEVHSSLERDDPIESTEIVSQDELENRSELRYEESELTDFLPSQTILCQREEGSQTSDAQNVLDYGDKGDMNSRQDTLEVLNQEVSQDQNMESISGETQAAREEAYLEQTNEVKETLEDFTVTDLIEIRPKHDMEEECPMNAEVVSEKVEVGEQFGGGEKEDRKAKEIDISYEDSYSQSLPAAQNKNVLSETLNVFDISHEEDLKEIVNNPEVHEPQPSWTSDADAPDTLQSRPDTLDRPEQNSDNDENPHIKSNSRGRRRKMGSTRRNLRGRHEEKNTEKMQDETSLMQLIQEKRGGMTTEVHSSLERDDPIESTEIVSQDELENRSELRYEESEITDFLPSQTILCQREEGSQTSDAQNVSDYGDKRNVNSRQDTLDVLNQEVSQDQNMESISGETQAAREEAYLEQTNEVKETLGDFTVTDLIEIRPKHDMEEECPMNAEVVSENVEVGEQFGGGEKEDHKAKEIDISYEDSYSQSLPAAQNKNVLSETLNVFDISHEEDLKEIVTNPEVHEPQPSWTSDADAPDTLQSRPDTLDRPEQNSDNDENPHIKSNSRGRRRKMGSTRRNLKDRHEEKSTEKMQDETSLMQLIQEKRGGMTTEVNSSLERDDPIESTEIVSQDELENRSELRYEESEITDFLPSQTILWQREEGSQTSDAQNVSDYGDKGNVNSRQDTLDVLNQEVSQDQNMESISGETQAAREEAYLEQTNEVKETLEDFTVTDLIEIRPKHDMEEEGPMNAEVVSEKVEVGEQFGGGEKEDRKAKEIDISYEDSYSQSLPAAQNKNVLSETLNVFDISHEEDLKEIVTNPEVHEPQPSWTSDADAPDTLQSRPDTLDRPEQNSDNDENPHIKSNSRGRRRKMGSTRRNLRGRHEEKNTEKMQEETSLMQLIQEKRGGMTTEVHSSLERDDPIESTEIVSQDELENRSELRYEESEITDFLPSQTILCQREEGSQTSDAQNVSDYGDKRNVNSRQDTLDVLNQEVSQDQNMESISGETQAAREEAYLEQTNEVKETLEDFTVTDLIEIRPKHDMEEECPMNAEVVSENVEVGEQFGGGEKEDHKAKEIDISYEDSYSQSLPAAQNKNVLSETLNVFDISHEEDLKEIVTNPEVHEPQPSWTSDADAPDTLQSRPDTLDRPEQNSDNDENPHIKSNSRGRRRKMGSTRRNLRDRHEEKSTEKMQDETSLMQLIQEKRGGMTTEVNSSLERDDPIESTEIVSQDELENRSELRYEESEITDFLPSQTILWQREEGSQTSDAQNVSDYGDKGNVNSRQDTLDVLNQEVSQDQNMESISGETQAAREEAYLEQTNEVKETLEDFTVTDLIEIRPKHDMEEEGPMNAEVVSENVEVGEQFGGGEKEDHKAKEIDISYEDSYSQSLPAAQNKNVLSETLNVFDISHEEDLKEIVNNPEVHEPQPSWTSDADAPDTLQSRPDTLDRPEQNSDNDENPHIKSNSRGRRRKMGSTRRNLRDRHEEKSTEKMQDETSLMQLIQEKRGGMTTEVNSSLERDDPIESTEIVSQDELENRSELRYEESEITDFLPSQTILWQREEGSQTSDAQNVSDYGDKGNVNSRQDTLDVLNQEVSQDQNMESISGETQAAREEAYLEQTNEVKETLEDFTVTDLIEIRPKHDMEEEGPMNAEVVSENVEVGEQFGGGEKEDHKAKEIDISYEDSYSQSLPAAQNKNVLSETLNVFDISHEEDLKEIVTNPEVHEPQPSWTSDADAPDTLQSRPDTLDRPEQNSDNDENPHIKSNSRGRRRKMGSTRRNLRDRHEEKSTEKMQDETSLMQLIQEKRGGMTTEVNSSLERDDPIESTEIVSQDELENRSELRYEESEITDFLPSQTILWQREEGSQTSDAQNVSDYGDKGNVNSRQDTLDVLNQEVSQDQNMESISGETQAAREEAYLEQTNEVKETLEDFTVTDLIEIRPKHDMEEEGPMNAEVVSENVEVGEQFGGGEKEDHKAKEIDISYEDSYSQSLPAAQNKNVLSETLNVFDISHEEDLKEIVTNPEVHEPQPSWTSDADAPDTLQSRPDTLDRPEQNSDNDENPHIKSNSRGRRRKMGSTRRNLRDRHEEKSTEKMQDETSLMQLIQEKRGGMTTEVNSSLERDDPIESTEIVSQDELENRSELRYEESEITDFLPSQTILWQREEGSQTSDAQNVSDYGDKGNVNSRQDTLDVLNQEVSQDQNMESISGETQAAREEAYLEQTNEVKETLEDFTVTDLMEIRPKHDMEEECPMNAEVVSEKVEVGEQFGGGEKEDHIAKEIDISYEDSYSQSLPAAQNKNVLSETLNVFDISHEEDLKEIVTNPEVHEPQPSWTSDADAPDTLQSRPDTLDRPEQNSDNDENPHIKSNSRGRRRKMGSTRRNLRGRHEEKNTEKMQDETSLMQLIQEKRGGMTTEVNSSLERDDPIESTEIVSQDELENRSELRYEESEIPFFFPSQTILCQKEEGSQTSDAQNVSDYGDKGNMNSRQDTLDVLNQEVSQDQNMESISGETQAAREEAYLEQTNEVKETLEDFKISDLIVTAPKYDAKVEGLMDAKVVSEKDEVGEQSGDPAKEDHVAQDIYEDTYNQAIQIKANQNVPSHTLDTLDFTEPAMHVFEQHLTSDADTSDVHQSQQDTLDRPEQTKDFDENGHVKFNSTRTRKKLGSSRRVPRSWKKDEGMDKKWEDERVEADLNTEVDMDTQVSFEAELKMLDELKYTASDEPQPLEERKTDSAANISSVSYVSTQSFNQQQNIAGNLDMFHMDSNIQSNIFNLSNEPMELTVEVEPFENTSIEDIRGGSLPAFKSEVITRNNEEITDEPKTARGRKMEIVRSEDIGGAQEGDENALIDKSGSFSCSNTSLMQENNVSKGADDTKREIETSRESNTTSRRRKMGSSRRNLRVKPEEDNLDVRQEAGTEVSEIAMDVEDATIAEQAFDVEKIDSQLNVELTDNDCEEQKPTLLEAVTEFSHTPCASHLIPMAHQSHLESKENPAIDAQHVDTVHHLNPSYLPSKLSASPKKGVHSEVKIEGRRRKMGSTRKFQGHQHEDSTENEKIIKDAGVRDLERITAESVIKTSEDQRAESISLTEKAQVDQSDKRPPSNNDSETREHSRTSDCLGQRAPCQPAGPGDQLVQEREKTHPLGNSTEFNLGPNHYNVVMVGNSNVGKTSFIKRAQNGEFCSDLSATIGIDTSVQSVTVDGKTVTLQIWDTAGQERFRSITRQVFHRAQAFLLMYDITSSQSFCDVRYWVTCIQEGAADDVAMVLLGNKSDCAKRQVHSDEGKALATEYNIDFMECSAATGENVIQSMEVVARMLSQRFKETEEESMVLHKEPQQNKSFGCC